MSEADTINVLNRLVAIHNRSLARYLTFASPAWHRGDDKARETLELIAADQEHYVDRFGEMVVDSGGMVDLGEFPIVYTGYHDLSFDWLLTKLIDGQQKIIAAIEGCVEALNLAPLHKAIAEESLGAAKGHLQNLEELQTASTNGAPS